MNAGHKNLITPLQNPRFCEGLEVVNFRSKKLAHLRERPTPVELAANIVQKLRKGALGQPVDLAHRKAMPMFELVAKCVEVDHRRRDCSGRAPCASVEWREWPSELEWRGGVNRLSAQANASASL